MKAALRHIFTFAASFAARPCCAVPAALALLGLGGVGFAAALVSYRPLIVGLAVLLFSASFYWNFIRNRNRAAMIVWGLSVSIAGGLLLGPELFAVSASANQRNQEAIAMVNELATVSVPVNGMACDACARRLEKVLVQTRGVSQASVSFEAKEVRVSYDPR